MGIFDPDSDADPDSEPSPDTQYPAATTCCFTSFTLVVNKVMGTASMYAEAGQRTNQQERGKP